MWYLTREVHHAKKMFSVYSNLDKKKNHPHLNCLNPVKLNLFLSTYKIPLLLVFVVTGIILDNIIILSTFFLYS